MVRRCNTKARRLKQAKETRVFRRAQAVREVAAGAIYSLTL
jgi:hypothetical protein